MSKFKVGEIAIIVATSSHPEHVGMECTISSSRHINFGAYGYVIEINGCVDDSGAPWFSWETELRKKPPKEETSSWEEIQKLTSWHPKKVTA